MPCSIDSLSDYLFVAARYAAKQLNIPELIWKKAARVPNASKAAASDATPNPTS